jgi:hypothetical protein
MIDDGRLMATQLGLKLEDFLVFPGRNGLDYDLHQRELLTDGTLDRQCESLILLLIMLRRRVVSGTVYAKEPL